MIASVTSVLPPIAPKWLQDHIIPSYGQMKCILCHSPSSSLFSFILDSCMQLHSKFLYMDRSNYFWEFVLQWGVVDNCLTYSVEAECFLTISWTLWPLPSRDSSACMRMCIIITWECSWRTMLTCVWILPLSILGYLLVSTDYSRKRRKPLCTGCWNSSHSYCHFNID